VTIQDYIASGIIENYVLGLADAKERYEFERLCEQHPELEQARIAFEKTLEQHAMDNAIPPPAGIKQQVMDTIQQQPSNNKSKLVTMENGTSAIRRNNPFRFVAAASVILLLGCVYFIYHFYNESKTLSNSNNELQAKLQTTDSILNQIIAEQKVVKDSNVTVVNMVGTQAAPRSAANVYWDSTSSNVYIVVKNMPKLPTDQQYQLWALIDGKPKDLGVFDVNDDKVILKMNNTQKADAFAITIEKKGGNPSPTLEKMQSLGKTKQPL
jgi:anti-sigma-K factor RskA